MEREILFRGKQVGNGEWAYGVPIPIEINCYSTGRIDLVKNINYDELDNYIPSIESEEVIPSTVGQYTGLTDRNGKKIFEGDICHFYGGEYYAGCWEANHICAIKINHECLWYIENIENVEIIGNIHDNPEMMKGEENG